jgi:hypothetical protein
MINKKQQLINVEASLRSHQGRNNTCSRYPLDALREIIVCDACWEGLHHQQFPIPKKDPLPLVLLEGHLTVGHRQGWSQE